MVEETRLTASDFTYPLFVTHGRDTRTEIPPMPGIYQLSLDQLIHEVGEAADVGIESVLLFGIPAHKDAKGTEAYARGGIIQEAIGIIKQAVPDMTVITDVCLCEFTDHGHCGVIDGDRIDNDATLELLARMAVARFTPTIQAQHAVFNQGGRGWVAVDDADTDERIFFQSWEARGRAAGTLVLVCRACYLTLVVCGRAIRRRRR